MATWIKDLRCIYFEVDDDVIMFLINTSNYVLNKLTMNIMSLVTSVMGRYSYSIREVFISNAHRHTSASSLPSIYFLNFLGIHTNKISINIYCSSVNLSQSSWNLWDRGSLWHHPLGKWWHPHISWVPFLWWLLVENFMPISFYLACMITMFSWDGFPGKVQRFYRVPPEGDFWACRWETFRVCWGSKKEALDVSINYEGKEVVGKRLHRLFGEYCG